MSSVTTLDKKLGRAMANAPKGLAEAEIPNAVQHRRSLPTPIDMIEVGDRLRAVDEAAVDHIAESMEQRGQIYPIQITTIEPSRFRLVNGAHRIAAARKLGWTHIEAFLIDGLEEEEVRLLEIDENLCRAELNAIDKAHFFAKRKEIYERLYPETKHGGDRKSLGYRNNIKWQQLPHEENNASPPSERAPSFVEDATASTPWSPRTIRLYTRIGQRLDPALREALADTPIGRRLKDLETISDMTPDNQEGLLQRLQTAQQPPTSLSALMKDPYRPPSPRTTDLDRLTALWSKTSASHRRQFIEKLCSEASEAEREEFRELLTLQGHQQ